MGHEPHIKPTGLHLASSLSLCQFCSRFQRCKLTFVFCLFVFSQWSIHEVQENYFKSTIHFLKRSPTVTYLSHFLSISEDQNTFFEEFEACTTRRKQVLLTLLVFPQCIFMGELWGPYSVFSEQLLWCKNVSFWYSDNHESNAAVSHCHGHYHLNQPECKKRLFLTSSIVKDTDLWDNIWQSCDQW